VNNKQQGSVLIITVVVLFAATMISLYAMRGTIIQDKMTANINNKVATSNAAEDGATQFLNWADNRFKTYGWPTSSSDKNSWKGNLTADLIPYTGPTNGVSASNLQNGRYYWIKTDANITGCSVANTNPCWDDTHQQVTVQITGNLIKGTGSDTKILGESVYQVKFAAPQAVRLPELPAALTLAGDVSSFSGASSNVFRIDGGHKLAIATDNANSNNTVKNGIPNNRNDAAHYPGGSGCPSSGACVKNTNLGLWGDANQVMELVNSIKNAPGVTYVDGSVNGNLPACSGIVIITGSLRTNGNQCSFTGILLVLGGNYDVRGNGGDYVGALYVANISSNGSGGYQFSNSPTQFSGGGNMTITYDSSLMDDSVNPSYSSKTLVLSWIDVL
jgi:Tfp pilus assembly protein PilX